MNSSKLIINVDSVIAQQEEKSDQSVLAKDKVSLPKKYKIFLHNDDYTTMEFVVSVLKIIFHKTEEEANVIMLEVHAKGIGVCGVYTFEVAETKALTVRKYAKDYEFPLRCTVEAE